METFVRNKGRQYVFNDTRIFLNSATRDGWKVRIFTYGDIAFQLAKFVGSGLSDLCHSITVTQDPKWCYREMFCLPSTIFLDDNPIDIDRVKYRFPHVTAVEVKRLNTKYHNVISSKADTMVDHLSWPLEFNRKG
jgi:hypothetical protein